MTVERPALNVIRIVHGDHVIEKIFDPTKMLIIYKSTPPPKVKEVAEKVVSVHRIRTEVEIDQLWHDERGMYATYECYEVTKDEYDKLLNYTWEISRGSELGFFLDDVRSKGCTCLNWDLMPPIDNPDPVIEKLLYTNEPTYALHTDVEKEEVPELGIFKTAVDGYITIRYSQEEEKFELRLYDKNEVLIEVVYVEPKDIRPIVEKLLDLAGKMYTSGGE